LQSSTVRATQHPLIHIVESDDWHLRQQNGLLWFSVLRELCWQLLRHVGARYYDFLGAFNREQLSRRREKRTGAAPANAETRKEADVRLLFARATMCEEVPVIEPSLATAGEAEPRRVDPMSIAPGVVPPRLRGRSPKCFFAMFNAFLAMAIRGRAPEPEVVHEELRSNPSFARCCGFTLPDKKLGYRQSDVPSLRKLEQFDQIMTANGLWEEAALKRVAENLRTGAVRAGATLVHDTTHYRAYSSMQTVEIPEDDGAEKPAVSPQDVENEEAEEVVRTGAEPRAPRQGKRARKNRKRKERRKRKSQAKATKNCRCKDRKTCRHPWVSADPGAGTVVKSGGKMHWAHKASTLAFAGQEILLDAVAMTDAASHDSRSLEPHLERLFTRHPELKGSVKRVLDDGAADDRALKERVRDEFSLELLTSSNPRGRKPIKENLPQGIDRLQTSGTPVCAEGLPFDFLGCRHPTKQFLFRAPRLPDGTPACQGCPRKSSCCRPGAELRHIAVPFDRLPWLDPKHPQLSRRFQKTMAKRTVIERIHKQMKFDYGDETLTKRGNQAFQARLDKTLLAMHMVLAHDT